MISWISISRISTQILWFLKEDFIFMDPVSISPGPRFDYILPAVICIMNGLWS